MIRNLFSWESGFQWQTVVFLAATLIGGVDLYIANLTGSVHPLLAAAALASPFVITWTLTAHTVRERRLIIVGSFALWFGVAGVSLLSHDLLAPALSSEEFRQTTQAGLSLTTAKTVGAIIAGISTVTHVGSWLYRRRTGGSNSGGATPEEQVLSAEEYEEFADPWDTEAHLMAEGIEGPSALKSRAN